MRILRRSLLLAVLALVGCTQGVKDVVQEVLTPVVEICSQDVIEVTTTEDLQGSCTGDGECSLRGAVWVASTCGSGQTITLQPDETYEVNHAFLQGRRIFSTNVLGEPVAVDIPASYPPAGLPVIFGRMRIEGSGATIRSTRTDFDGIEREFPIFYVWLTGDLGLENVTLTNANASAIRNQGRVGLDTVVVEGNESATDGGGVQNIGGSARLVSTTTLFRNNQADRGGGLYNEGVSEVNDNDFEENVARVEGGALFNAATGILSIGQNSKITEGHATLGGGIRNLGQATVERSAILSNRAELTIGNARGGGIHNQGQITLRQVTISANYAAPEGGAIYNDGSLGIERSTISGNSAELGPATGGGIYNDSSGRVVMVDTTIYRNSLNRVREGFVIDPEAGGAGITNVMGGTMRVTNTIIAGNSPGQDCGIAVSLDFRATGPNLASDDTCPGFPLSNIDPLLDRLADNRVPATQTHRVNAGTPAHNTGGGCLAADQRGFSRGADPCDIGAFELQSDD